MSDIDDLTPVPDQPEISEGNQVFHQKSYALYKWMREKLGPAMIELRVLMLSMVGMAFNATSASSMALTLGVKNIVTDPGRSYTDGTPVRVALVTDPANYFADGICTAYNTATGDFSFNIISKTGTGTFTNWSLSMIPPGSDFAGTIHAATSKATPVDADELGLVDSAASFSFKRLTWVNVKATLKTYFDTLYVSATSVITTAGDPTFADSSTNAASTGWVKGLTKFTKEYISPQQTITSGGALTLAHGLGVKPKEVTFVLQCTTAEFGFSVGDEVTQTFPGFNASNRGVQIIPGVTNLNVRYGNDATPFVGLRLDTGALAALTNANWLLIIKAWA